MHSIIVAPNNGKCHGDAALDRIGKSDPAIVEGALGDLVLVGAPVVAPTHYLALFQHAIE